MCCGGVIVVDGHVGVAVDMCGGGGGDGGVVSMCQDGWGCGSGDGHSGIDVAML